MKTIYIRTDTMKEAFERSKMLYEILKNCTPVIVEWQRGKNVVRTSNFYVRYININGQPIDGLRCDIPCGFGGHGKVMAKSKKYKELSDEWEIADFIEKEEQANE